MLYQRLADELAALIERRALRPGDRLPSVRGYSRQKRVSLATVLRTYQVLEDRGYIEVRPQSGHYVRGALPLPPSPSLRRVAPARAEVKLADLIWELLSHVNDPGLAPFGVATAAPEHYPARRLGRLLARVARDADWTGVAYGHPAGHELLLHQLVRRGVAVGIALSPDELVVTNGCTEAIQLALRALTRPGDAVLVESPSYYGFLELAESLGLVVVEVETDPETGVGLDALEAAIRRTRPRVDRVAAHEVHRHHASSSPVPTFRIPLASRCRWNGSGTRSRCSRATGSRSWRTTSTPIFISAT